MTSPSSYVFYESRNSAGERKEGTLLSRVFITDTKITLYAKEIVKTAKSGVLFEKIRHQTTFSLHKNSHGDKYLKRSNKSAGGSITDTSLEGIMGGQYLHFLVTNASNHACRSLIEETIMSWFGSEYKYQEFETCKKKLLFPALRDASFPANIDYALAAMQRNTSLVTKALRENNSWNSFVEDICSPMVKSVEDIRVIQTNPGVLLPIGVMDLGVSMSALYERDKDTLLKMNNSFCSNDLKFITFMFKNLDSTAKRQSLEVLLDLVKLNQWRRKSDAALQRLSLTRIVEDLKGVPVKLRAELANELADSLMKTKKSMESLLTVSSTVVAKSNPIQVETDLKQVFWRWYAIRVVEPQLKTETTFEDLDNRYLELFGVNFPRKTSTLNYIQTGNDLILYRISKFASRGTTTNYSTDLFSSLNSLVVKNRPKDKGTGQRNAYVDDSGKVISVEGETYSLDDIMKIIEQGAAETDAQLTRLGRKITPENRRAFLTLGSKERKFKNTWMFYDWGVTDPAKILALKSSKVTKKTDVQTYNALPDDMFYEFLALESGKEFTTTMTY